MRKLPPLNSLRAFEAAARLRSFSLAARELGVTHGAISHQVRQLEQFLGAPLFVPSGRGLEPTETGLGFAADVGAALDQIASATERLIEPAGSQLVRLNAPPAFTLHWLFPRLRGFQRLHPSIEARLSTSGQSFQEVGLNSDVIIRRSPMSRDGYDCQLLMEDWAVPVCTPDLLKEHPVNRPADLLHHTILTSDSHNGAWETWLSGAGVCMPRRRLRFEHYHVLLQAALEGMGVTLGPAVLVDDDIREGRLAVAIDRPRVRFDPFHVLYRTEGPNRQRTRIFVDWLMGEAASFVSRWAVEEPAL
jgi:LysR family transcriptional regulator, glycine cleavage system transcriptional activator